MTERWEPVCCYPDTDAMVTEVRPQPATLAGDRNQIGGEDAGEDLVIHCAADGKPWLWEIEREQQPEHIAVALAEIQHWHELCGPRRSPRVV
jgi:hypothetical protein